MEYIKMPAPCVGTLQKTHRRSKFVRFHVATRVAEWIFSDSPHLHKNGADLEIVVLQIMCFADRELLIEYVEKQYWEE